MTVKPFDDAIICSQPITALAILALLANVKGHEGQGDVMVLFYDDVPEAAMVVRVVVREVDGGEISTR